MDIKEMKSKPCWINAIIDKEYSRVLETVYTWHWFSYLRPVRSPSSNNCEGPAVDHQTLNLNPIKYCWKDDDGWFKDESNQWFSCHFIFSPFQKHLKANTFWILLGCEFSLLWGETLNLFFSAWSSTAPQSPDTSLVIYRWTPSNWGL